jgi:hypothetical protein
MQASVGKMSAYKMFNWRDRAANSVEQTVTAFLEIGEAIATRWIQTAKGVLLLQMVPDNGASVVVYVFDRRSEVWFLISFEGCEDQFTSAKFDRAFSEYDLFRLVEPPSLLLTEFQPANAKPTSQHPRQPIPPQLRKKPSCVCPQAKSVRSAAHRVNDDNRQS